MKNLKSKIQNEMKRPAGRQRGMTYVELIVVLSIFAVMSSLVIFNYGGFQSRIDIKNLAGDIALQISQAQRNSVDGALAPVTVAPQPGANWKPSYGILFDLVSDTKSFIYFADTNNNNSFDGSEASCSNNECISKISITKGDYLYSIYAVFQDQTRQKQNSLIIDFVRPNSGANIVLNNPPQNEIIDHVEITVSSQDGKAQSLIDVYPSGRIEIQ